METAIVAIISIALMVVGGMTMSRGFISTAVSTTNGLKQLQITNSQMTRTDLSVESGTLSTDGSLITITLKNTGQTKIYDYDKWDFIVQYCDSSGLNNSCWLPYSSGLNTNHWNISGIYINAVQDIPEQFDVGILDPTEDIVLTAQLSPTVGASSAIQVTISTPNGIHVSTIISRQ